MPQVRKYRDHAARQRAYRRRQKKRRAAAVRVPLKVRCLVKHLCELREEITRRRAVIGCARGRKRLNLPGPSGWQLSALLVKLLSLVNFIESELDKTGILAEGKRSA